MRRFELAVGAGAPSEARRIVAAIDGLPSQRLADVQIIVSELVTNALRHSGLQTGSRIGLTLGRDDAHYLVEVEDGGGFRGAVEPAGTRPPGLGGLGLVAVATLSERWEARDGRVTAWVAI